MRKKAINSLLITILLLASSSFGQELARKEKNKTIAPAAASQVVGGGTSGRLSRWSGVSGSSTYVLGDSNIFEDKFGKIGIGTTTPTSLLTVQGMIEITMGGLKFPDGTVQTTSAVGSLFTVAHDATLIGNGTVGSPLGVAVPLVLTGSSLDAIMRASNTGQFGTGVIGKGGPDGIGVLAFGGSTDSPFQAGPGLFAVGGGSDTGTGGQGVAAFGGEANMETGGVGVEVLGGGSRFSTGGRGVFATGGNGSGVGKSGGVGIEATAGIGINGATPGMAGIFNGNVQVTGTLSKGGGSFKIDHPLDPETKYLYHSFVESPDMMNIYNGNITTNENGEATVTLPDYFGALNRAFRYQLTVIGQFAQAIVAEKIKDNRFIIKTNAPNVEVSWQITGIRQDAFANKNRIPVEEAKPEVERGYYLHPEAFNQPEEKSINWARDPERMQQLKQQRLEADQGRERRPSQQ